MADHTIEPYQLISHYQLENLLNNRVQFFFLDLRSDESRASAKVQHPLLRGATPVRPSEILNYLQSVSAATNSAIVLICENGSNSIAALQVLVENSFINAFALKGGVESLPD